MERYICNLDEVTLTKAHNELNEPLNNEVRLQLIDKLRHQYNQKHPELKLEGTQNSDYFLIRFLRARKFQIPSAIQILYNYLQRRTVFPEAFLKFDQPNLLNSFLETKFVTVLEGTATNKSKVIMLRPTYGTEKPIFIDIFTSVFLIIEKLLEDERNQINGITLLEDLSYTNMYLVRQLGPNIGRKLTGLIQDAMPIRLKNICILNESFFFNIVYTIISPFLKEKTRKRIVLIGSNYHKLFPIIPKNVLPLKYGGEVGEDDLQFEKWRNLITDL